MSNVSYHWERRQGGVRPWYMLRKYNEILWGGQSPGLSMYNPIVGMVQMSSPKRKRWRVEVVKNYETHVLGYLDRMRESEALDAAKVLILGNLT